MIKAIFTLLFASLLSIGCTNALGAFFGLEDGNQVYQVFALTYMVLPALIARMLAKEEGIHLSFATRKTSYLVIPVLLPLAILLVAFGLTVAFDFRDTLALAPTHELTVAKAFWRVLLVSSNYLGFAIVYGLSIQLAMAVGQEMMWRGYLFSKAQHLGFWKLSALLGVIAGLWQAPLTLFYGIMYPEHNVLGMLWVVVLSVLLSPILTQLRISSRSLLPSCLFHAFYFSLASLLSFIVSEPDHLLGGMTGLTGFAALGIANLVLHALRHKEKVRTVIVK